MDIVLHDEVVATDDAPLGSVRVERGGFDGDVERFFTAQANGLVGGPTIKVGTVHPGCGSGGSQLQIKPWDSRPGDEEQLQISYGRSSSKSR